MANNNQFNLEVGVQLSTRELDQQLKDYTKKSSQRVTIQVDGKDAIRETSTYVNNLGKTIKTVQTMTKDGLVGKTTVKSIKDTNASLKEAEKQVNHWTDSMGKLKTYFSGIDDSGQKFFVHVNEWQNALGGYEYTVEKFNTSNKRLAMTEQEMNEYLYQAKVNYGGVLAEVDNLNVSQNTLNGTLEKQKSIWEKIADSALGKVTKFGLSTKIFQGLYNAVFQSVDVIKDFDATLTEFKKVSDLGGESLQNYVKELGELGTEVGRTRTEMLEASAGFVKSGYSEEDAKQLSRLSALLQNIADEELSASDATAVLVSQMKAYGKDTAEFASHTIDAINEVANNKALSTGDLIKGLQLSSASMATYGNSLEETIGLLTSATEIMQGRASQVSRALNAIGARLITNEDELAKYGVAVKDSNGELLSTYDILTKLKPKWDEMSNAEQQELGLKLSGVNNYRVFASEMKNLQSGVEATAIAYNSLGSAEKENSRYMDSLEARTAKLKAEYEKLVLGEGGLQDCAKMLVTLGTNSLKLINNLGGLPPVLTAIATAIAVIKAESIVGGIDKIINIFPTLFTGLGTTQVMLNGVAISLSAVQLAMGGIGVVIAGATYAIHKYNEYWQEQARVANEAKEAVRDYNVEAKECIKNLRDSNTSLQEAIDLNQTLGGSYDSVNDAIGHENELLQENIDLLHEKAVLEAKEALEASKKDYEKTKRKMGNGDVLSSPFGDGIGDTGWLVWDDNLKALSKGLFGEASAMYDMFDKKSKKHIENIEDEKRVISEYEELQRIANSTTEEWLQYLDEQGNKLQVDLSEEEDLFEDVAIAEEELIDINEGYVSTLDDISSAYDTLTNAVDEYNNNGAMSIDTISELIKMGDGWINCLQIENGQMAINQDALLKVLEAKKEEQREIINATALKKLETLETEYLQKAEATNAEILDSETRSLALNTEQLYQNALQRARLNKEIKDGGYFADVKKIEAERQQALKLLDSVNLSSFSIGSSKASGSSKSSKSDAEKAQKEALQAQKDALKKEAEEAKKAINKEIDDVNDKINGLKKTISSVKDSYSDQIADLKELKEAKVAEIDAEIDALNKEKQARKDYWDEMLKDIEKENKERDRAIALEEKLQNISLASKKRLMVFKDGKFQYVKDEEAIAKAQADYDELLRKQEEERNKEHLQELRDQEQKSYEVRLEELKEFKSATQAEYDDQIKALEKLRDAIVDSINVEIESWEAKKDELQDTLKAQTEFYNNSLDALNDYVNNYNNTLSHMASPSTPKNDIPSEQPAPKVAEKPITTKTTTAKKSTTHKVNTSLSAFATGNNYVGDNQMALVGDNPNYREIVVGSKLNNDAGMLMSLKRGAGVVNASATNTLASLFNNRAVSSGTLVNNKASNNTTISIGNISLPEVKNGQDFVQYLQNFSMDLTQDSYRR